MPSLLGIPSDPPLSPLSPVNPLAKPHHHASLPAYKSTPTYPLSPPPKPLPWLWQCHLCSRAYPLAVTTRCIEDGHRFCSRQQHQTATTGSRRGGSNTEMEKTLRNNSSKKARKAHKACKSEFDYAGWKVWGEWRRHALKARRHHVPPQASNSAAAVAKGKRSHNCAEQCDYPSECRWSATKKQELERGNADAEAAADADKENTTPAPPTEFDQILAAAEEPNSTHDIPPSLIPGVLSSPEWHPERSSSLPPHLSESERERDREGGSQNPLFDARTYGDSEDEDGDMLTAIEDLDPLMAPPTVPAQKRRRKTSGGTGRAGTNVGLGAQANMLRAWQKARFFARNLELL